MGHRCKCRDDGRGEAERSRVCVPRMTVPFAGAATALVVCTLTIWSTKAEEADAPAVETPVVKVGKPDSEARKSPTLMSSPGPGAQKPTMDDPNALAPAGTSNKEDVAQVAQA